MTRSKVWFRTLYLCAVWSMCAGIFAIGGLATRARAAEVSLVDGRVIEGAISGWENGTLRFTTENETLELATEAILRIRLAAASESQPQSSVELVDGSVLPLQSFTAKDSRAAIDATGAQEPLAVPTNLIDAVHLQPPTPTIAAQWDELRKTQEAGDLIVIRKEGAIDHLAGRLGDITETDVMFFFDEEEFPVERGRVDGVVYYHAAERELPEPLCVIRGRGGLKLVAAAATMEDDALKVRTTSGVPISLPRNVIESIDFSAGKVVYLAELAPRSASTTPLVAFPTAAAVAAELYKPISDRGFFGAEVLLRYPQYDGERLTGWELKAHTRSVGLRSRSDVVYALPEDFSRFRATAGIDGTLGGRGNVHLAVYGDDELLWEGAIDGNEPPAAIDLDIADVRHLRILVDYGEGGDAADRLYLCDARITK